MAFLDKYDSVPPADLAHLSIDEICVAAGVDAKLLLSLALDRLFYIGLNKVRIQVFSSLPGIVKRGWPSFSSSKASTTSPVAIRPSGSFAHRIRKEA